MGMFTSEKSQTTNNTSISNPWSAQSPFLTQGFDAAANALKQAQGVQGPNNFVAQYTPEQLNAFQTMMRTGMGPGATASGTAAANTLNTSGASATAGGLYDLANWKPGMTSQGVMNDANMFANNPAISGQVDAAMRDSVRNASENVLPGLQRQAAGTGNLNSSRNAISQGIVQRGLSDQAGDISANLRANAFNQGLNTATTVGSAGDSNSLAALMGRVSGGTGAVGTGTGAGVGAVNQQGGLYDIAQQGIAGGVGATQAGYDNDIAKYQFGTQSPYAGLENYWNIVGGQNWGGTKQEQGTVQQVQDPSTWSKIGSIAGTIGSFF
jgi:hypothetical protein